MEPLCTSCDISGKEEKMGTGMTVEECKLECMDDPNCFGIDFGKDKREGECYFNYEEDVGFGDHDNFDAWRKKPDCGTLLHDNYKLHKLLLLLIMLLIRGLKIYTIFH